MKLQQGHAAEAGERAPHECPAQRDLFAKPRLKQQPAQEGRGDGQEHTSQAGTLIPADEEMLGAIVAEHQRKQNQQCRTDSGW